MYIVISHTLGFHMDVMFRKKVIELKYDTIYTHFQGITINIYGFGRPFFVQQPSTHIFACPYSLLPVQMTGGRVSS